MLLTTTRIMAVLLCCGGFLGQSFAVQAQEKPPQAFSVVHELHSIKSQALREDRHILVRLPLNYADNDRRFPLLVMLDGHLPNLNSMPAAIDTLTTAGLAPEMILVSIPNVDRVRDFTPTVLSSRPGSGGSALFSQFIAQELIPYIDSRFRCNGFRVLVGHSLGGLFVISALAQQDQLFSAYLAASPVAQWDDEWVIKLARKKLNQIDERPRFVFAALGAENEYESAFFHLKDTLRLFRRKGIDISFHHVPDEDHVSTPMWTYLHGLRWLWQRWQMQEVSSFEAFTQQQDAVASHYGVAIPFSEHALNLNGYHLLAKNKLADALKLMQITVAQYPESANAHDSLAEAFEKNGDKFNAQQHYQRAVALAQRANNSIEAQLFESHLKRLTGQ